MSPRLSSKISPPLLGRARKSARTFRCMGSVWRFGPMHYASHLRGHTPSIFPEPTYGQTADPVFRDCPNGQSVEHQMRWTARYARSHLPLLSPDHSTGFHRSAWRASCCVAAVCSFVLASALSSWTRASDIMSRQEIEEGGVSSLPSSISFLSPPLNDLAFRYAAAASIHPSGSKSRGCLEHPAKPGV